MLVLKQNYFQFCTPRWKNRQPILPQWRHERTEHTGSSFLKSVLPKTAIHSQCSLTSEATGNHKKVGKTLIWLRIKTDTYGYLADPGYRQCAVESFQ